MIMKKIAIVIVNYNGEAYQNDCMKSFYDMDYLDFDVIVVDSASQDNSIKSLLECYPQTIVLKQDENVGVAKGNNIGIQYALDHEYEYILLSNNDIVVDSKMLGIMVQNISEREVVVPKIYYYNPSNLIWFAGGRMNWKSVMGEHIGENEIDHGQYNDSVLITYAPTCCMLFHRSVFETVGLEDENYFMYYDDTDLCARMLNKGYDIKYVPDAFMWHKVSSSSGGSTSKVATYYHNRNKLYFVSKFRDSISLVDRINVYIYGIVKYLVSFVYKKYNREIYYSYRDYLKGNMSRRV